MVAYRVSGRALLLDDIRMLIDRLAECKECRMRLVFGENVQDLGGVRRIRTVVEGEVQNLLVLVGDRND